MKKVFLSVFICSSFGVFAQGGGEGGGHIQGQRQRPTRSAPEADCSSDLEYDKEADVVLFAKSQTPFTGVCRSYYEDSRLEREVNFVDGKEDGISTTYYKRKGENDDESDPSPGQIQVITEHKMGVPNGVWKYFYENGKAAWINTYKEGKKDGTWEYYYDDKQGTPKKIENWKEDKKNGVFIDYFPSGKKKTEINYKENVMDGDYKMYYDDESPFVEKKYVNGKQDGEEISYHKNGQMASLKRYKLGTPEGTWRTYYDDGKEHTVVTYVKGKIVGEQVEYFKEGQLKRKINYTDGKITRNEGFDEFGNQSDIETITYFKNGKTATVKREKQGYPDGQQKIFYENGNPKLIENYAQGRLMGEQKEFYENGKLRRKVIYEDGEIVLTEEYDEKGKKIGE